MAARGEAQVRIRLVTLLFFLLFSFSGGELWSAELADVGPEIRSIMEGPRYRHARWGLFVVEMGSRKPLLAHHE
ncbi:MAG: hypothetical protein N2Z74_03725, partial [Syntrophales bacterium]|nr:hypothetical protein [Syntrophales bacterium]